MKGPSLLGDGLFIVLHNVGILLRYMALLPLLLLPVTVYYGEWWVLPALVATSGVFLGAGIVMSLLPTRREPRLREGLLIAAVGWLLVPLGSVVLFVWAENWRLLDAFVESMSAWTGTGITLADVTVLSKTTLAWRSLMQWVGGLGVIVLTLAILARPGSGAHALYASETREDKLRPSILSTVRTLWKIYAIFTIAAIVLLFVAGMDPWSAINHGMTAIGTAGMSTEAAGIGAFDSFAIELALIPIMLVGSLPFVATYALMRGRWHGFLRDEQVRAMLLAIIIAIPMLAWALMRQEAVLTATEGWREALFQGVSAITTTGFQTVDVARWQDGTKLGIAGLMILGGAAGSTAGGIKLVRGVLLLKGTGWKLRKSGLPHFSITTFPFGGARLSDQEANEEFAEASFILVLWAAAFFAALLTFLTVLPPQHDLGDIIFEVASLMGNNGMSTGIISMHMPDVAKFLSAVLMWAGRLEILPVLLLLRGFLPLPRGR